MSAPRMAVTINKQFAALDQLPVFKNRSPVLHRSRRWLRSRIHWRWKGEIALPAAEPLGCYSIRFRFLPFFVLTGLKAFVYKTVNEN